MTTAEKARSTFNMHDHDKDGEINLVELVEIMGELNLYFTTGLEIMSRFGRKGRIKFEEFWEGTCKLERELQDEEDEMDSEPPEERDDSRGFRSGSIIYQGKLLTLSEDDEY
jgi:hypothetical protein